LRGLQADLMREKLMTIETRSET